MAVMAALKHRPPRRVKPHRPFHEAVTPITSSARADVPIFGLSHARLNAKRWGVT
jgi:hypothetical protein